LSTPASCASLDRAFRLAAAVDATETLQAVVVETLHAEADAVHAGLAITLEAAVFDRARDWSPA
jgi:hypothetical protein